MTKAQLTAMMLAAASVGAGGTKVLEAALADAPPQIHVHALDLRRGADLPDGGYTVSRVAYGNVSREDGGVKDIGQAKRCGAGDQAVQRAMLDLAAAECEWER